jgi:alkanesulfonate monooxygenase SsuD/methylene tetrahydromethanopterin reductase-like flavin-dependent oxidoreductase (luciferase family)
MQFGVFDHIDTNGLPAHTFYEQRLAIVEAYEAAGFYAYHCAEHHLSPIGMVASPSVFLAAVAQRTKRLRFGPLVYALPLYHPLRLIEEICLLDQLSGGRLELGFGRGSSRAENQYFGQRYDEAQSVYAETLETVLSALRSGTYSQPGGGPTFQNVPLQVQPYQRPHPPIWYGVHSIESAARAGRQGLHLVSLDTAAETRAFADRHREVWRQTHADGTPPRVGISRFITLADDDDTALRTARRAYRRWHESFYHAAHRHGYQVTHQRPAEFDGMAAAGKAVAGSPATVLAALERELEVSGADYLVGQFAFGDASFEEVRRSIELFAAQVMPALRAREPAIISASSPTSR